MPHHPRVLATAAGLILLLVGCSADDTAPATAPPSTDAPPRTDGPPPSTQVTPTTGAGPDGTLGGSGPPAAGAGEFDLTSSWAIAGTAELDGRACWWLAGDGDRGLLIAPTGTEVGDAGDTLVTPDGRVVADGDTLDIDGVVLYGIGELPGGADGKWGSYLEFCGPEHPIVVAKTLIVPENTDLATAAVELADRGATLFGTDHGCGYGFATGSADERWALRLYVTGNEPIDSGTITLPDDRFDGVVRVGRHLFANHCDDVVEWFEPNPVIDATWPIVAGSFDYPGSDGTGDCNQGAVTTTLNEAVVDVDGTRVDLGPVTIQNGSFGCFAG